MVEKFPNKSLRIRKAAKITQMDPVSLEIYLFVLIEYRHNYPNAHEMVSKIAHQLTLT